MSESDEIEKEQREIDERQIKKVISELSMRFDSVQIFVTRQEAAYEQTAGCSMGAGNWYARYGQIRAWIENGGVMKQQDPMDEGDGEEI